MKTKDLMMRDWIQSPITPKPLKVAQINWDYSVECVGIDDMIRYHVGLGDIKPILITPEILEKNGFEMKPDGDGQHDRFTLVEGHTSFSLKYARSVFQWLNPIDFKYVHQLQHALRLCGIKKEIQL